MAQTLTFTGGQLDGRTMSLSGVTSGQNNAAANTNYLLLPGGCDLTNPTVQANYITVIPASGLTLVSRPPQYLVYQNQGSGSWSYVAPPT
jgi:hypothetical protein